MKTKHLILTGALLFAIGCHHEPPVDLKRQEAALEAVQKIAKTIVTDRIQAEEAKGASPNPLAVVDYQTHLAALEKAKADALQAGAKPEAILEAAAKGRDRAIEVQSIINRGSFGEAKKAAHLDSLRDSEL